MQKCLRNWGKTWTLGPWQGKPPRSPRSACRNTKTRAWSRGRGASFARAAGEPGFTRRAHSYGTTSNATRNGSFMLINDFKFAWIVRNRKQPFAFTEFILHHVMSISIVHVFYLQLVFFSDTLPKSMRELRTKSSYCSSCNLFVSDLIDHQGLDGSYFTSSKFDWRSDLQD